MYYLMFPLYFISLINLEMSVSSLSIKLSPIISLNIEILPFFVSLIQKMKWCHVSGCRIMATEKFCAVHKELLCAHEICTQPIWTQHHQSCAKGVVCCRIHSEVKQKLCIEHTCSACYESIHKCPLIIGYKECYMGSPVCRFKVHESIDTIEWKGTHKSIYRCYSKYKYEPVYSTFLCKQHTCSALECRNYKEIESTYCKEHTSHIASYGHLLCKTTGCMKFIVTSLQLCQIHIPTCTVYGCTQLKYTGSKYFCKIHAETTTCVAIGCTMPLEFKYGHSNVTEEEFYCQYHMRTRTGICAVRGCCIEELCHGTYSSVFCAKHTCPATCSGQCWKKGHAFVKSGYCRKGGLSKETK